MEYILASASPRRKELFEFIASDFVIKPANVDESLPDNIKAEDSAEYLATIKATAVASQNSGIVVGCDTVVVVDNKVLGKPCDKEDAFKMLSMLSGKTHKVITGVCIICGEKKVSFSEVTEVEFYTLDDKEIYSYIETGDPMDKAGAYGIQSQGCMLVKGIKGDFFNVVGLPVARLKREIVKVI